METRILEKARELFFFFGVKSITMDDLCKHLGISKKTLYTYYKDKNELVHLIMGDLLDQHVAEMAKLKDKATNAVDEVVLNAKALYSVFKDLKPNVIFEVEKYFPELAEQFLNHRHSCMLEVIKENLERGKTEGLYREDIETDFVAQVRLNQLVSAFDEKAYPLVAFNVQKIIYKLTSLYLNSICSIKGKQLIAIQ
ncbi:TetR/AcrR family transcriptional regulator [Pedobacter arcticus]|uniref:TetR/AcrR family transcriptional regulator n=1 Tax=Pedobacter arcticus TaxID=752140 RepID=UPI0002E87C0B|nr:TetR/AcrR family transcriptional regulator [Pedobacter arcticus]